MNSAYRIPVCWVSAYLLMLISLSSFPQTAQAQAQPDGKPPLTITTVAQTRERLAQKVQLKLGENKLCQSWSKRCRNKPDCKSKRRGICANIGYRCGLRRCQRSGCAGNTGRTQRLEVAGCGTGACADRSPTTQNALEDRRGVADIAGSLAEKTFRRFIGSSGAMKDAMYMPGNTYNMTREQAMAAAKATVDAALVKHGVQQEVLRVIASAKSWTRKPLLLRPALNSEQQQNPGQRSDAQRAGANSVASA